MQMFAGKPSLFRLYETSRLNKIIRVFHDWGKLHYFQLRRSCNELVCTFVILAKEFSECIVVTRV
jgi:hypothetical protein